MKTLRINNSTKLILVDDEDYLRCTIYNWGINGGRRIVKTTNPRTPIANYVMKNNVNVYDHKDRNFLNNQKDNLRVATQSQNLQNRDKISRCSSKYKGVYKFLKSWRAKLNQEHLGLFMDEIEAAKAYDKAALKKYGEFAVLNFPQEINKQEEINKCRL